jgi:hypothetical protein
MRTIDVPSARRSTINGGQCPLFPRCDRLTHPDLSFACTPLAIWDVSLLASGQRGWEAGA